MNRPASAKSSFTLSVMRGNSPSLSAERALPKLLETRSDVDFT